MSPSAPTKKLFDALRLGDECVCHDVLQEMQDGGATVSTICETIANVFGSLGQSWECGELSVYQEHVASQIAYGLIHHMLGEVGQIANNAPVAIGCTPENDPYVLATTMVELVLRDTGWKAQSLGTNLPLREFESAIAHYRPKIAWVSVSATPPTSSTEQDLVRLSACCHSHGAELVCGGRTLPPPIRARNDVTSFDYLHQLANYARAEVVADD